MSGKTVTLSALVYQNTGSPVQYALRLDKPSALDNWTGNSQIGTSAQTTVQSGILTQISATFTLGATDAQYGLCAFVEAWVTGPLTGKDFHITDYQLEVGPVVTPFEKRPYGLELSLCQRYYEKSYDDTVTPGSVTQGGAEITRPATTEVNFSVRYKVPKRAVTTPVAYSTSGTAGYTAQQDGTSPGDKAIAVANQAKNGFRAFGVIGSIGAYCSFQWAVDAEL